VFNSHLFIYLFRTANGVLPILEICRNANFSCANATLGHAGIILTETNAGLHIIQV
jgi:hypothetical protein